MSTLPKGGYGIVGRMAMRSDKVSKEAKAVYALLCSYTGGKHYCYPSVETLAKDLQTSTRTIIRLTEELKAHGFSRKIKVGKDKRKTAYIPLHPYGGIGDTDDTYLEEMDDTDDMRLGDTSGTVRITENNNSISITPRLKESKTKNKKAAKKVLSIPEIEPLIKIIVSNGMKESAISSNLKMLMLNAVELHGIEFCDLALRGRYVQAARQQRPAALGRFFDPENGEWMTDCSKLATVPTVQAGGVVEPHMVELMAEFEKAQCL